MRHATSHRRWSLTLEEFAIKIPKIELHLHLEGSVHPATFVELAGKNGLPLPAFDDPAELYRYDNLLDFLRVYDLVCKSVIEKDDFRRISFEALRSCAAGGARYVEFFFSPHPHLACGVRYADMLDGIFAGMHQAKAELGIASQLIPAHSRVLGPERGVDFVKMVLDDLRPGIIGVGLDYDELPNNPALFRAMYDLARANGLHRTAHAGEVGPAAFVREAIEDLQVERVDHGYHIVDDPRLVAECRERGIFFTCCPSTTLTTTTWRNLADPGHAIRRMIDQGLKVTINSDDPPMFGTNLAHEFVLCVRDMRLTAEQLKTCVLNSIHASWLEDATKQEWAATWSTEIDDMAAQLAKV
jgi:adenosine deaminase